MYIPENIKFITDRLEQNGFEAYLVGGCVRDMLMGKEPHDYDITTNALPESIIKCFSDCRLVLSGLKHGTVAVICGGEAIEVTTYRIDGDYSDSRHPESVKFAKSIELDLARRDFTMNAIACSTGGRLIDVFGGKSDIEKKIIKCVGDPDKRFGEDALRIMRAARFSSVLGFDIEEKTAAAADNNAVLLKNISSERIYSELCKMVCGENVLSVLTERKKVICEIIPEFNCCVDFCQHNIHHCYDVYTHTAHAVQSCPNDLYLRLAALFHDIGKPQMFFMGEDNQGHFYGHAKKSAEIAEGILKRLKAPNDVKENVILLIRLHDRDIVNTPAALKRLLSQIGADAADRLFELKKADTLAQSEICRNRIAFLSQAQEHMREIVNKKECFSVKNLEINGRDLISCGCPQSKKIGEILNELLSLVINGEIENEHEALALKAKELIKKND